MRRSTVIATCLVQARVLGDLQSAERAVREQFAAAFPGRSFDHWNREVEFRVAQAFINNGSGRPRIDVTQFIRDLGEPR
jgi:hypothetical protein